MNWKTLGAVAPTELVDARLQLHHATQVVAAAAVTFLAPEPDDGHPNSGWVESLGALLGRHLPSSGARVGLRFCDITLLLVDTNGEVRDELSLDGRTLADAHAWLASVVAQLGLAVPAAGIHRATYEIPHHRVADDAAFSFEANNAFTELAHWFSNGHDVLAELAARTSASEVRCWPHHFDLGSLAVIATQPDGSLARSIGMGLSPGDESCPEPYWYISPWPYPEPNALPALAGGGHWHTEGYTSAIFTGSDLVGGSPASQSDRLQAFLDAAIDASRRAVAP